MITLIARVPPVSLFAVKFAEYDWPTSHKRLLAECVLIVSVQERRRIAGLRPRPGGGAASGLPGASDGASNGEITPLGAASERATTSSSSSNSSNVSYEYHHTSSEGRRELEVCN